MSPRIEIALASFCIAMSGLFIANLFLTIMIAEINRKRQDGNMVSYLGFTFPKMLRIFKEYRALYPNGYAHVYSLTAFAFAMMGLISVAICLRIVG
jgi:hypothetical protein